MSTSPHPLNTTLNNFSETDSRSNSLVLDNLQLPVPPSPYHSSPSSSSHGHSLYQDSRPASIDDSMRELRELLCNVESDENYRSMLRKSTSNRNTAINLARPSKSFRNDEKDTGATSCTSPQTENLSGTDEENEEEEDAFTVQPQTGFKSRETLSAGVANDQFQARSNLRNGRRAKPPPLNLDGISNVNTQQLNAAAKKNQSQHKDLPHDVPVSHAKSPTPYQHALSPTDGILDYYINCNNSGADPRRIANQLHSSASGKFEQAAGEHVLRRSKSLAKQSIRNPRLDKEIVSRPALSAGFRHTSPPTPQVHPPGLNSMSPPLISDIVQYERLAGIYGWETSSTDFLSDGGPIHIEQEEWEEQQVFYQDSMIELPTDSGIEAGHNSENRSISSNRTAPSKPESDFKISLAEKDRRKEKENASVKGTVKKALNMWFGGSAKQKISSTGVFPTTTTSIAITKRKISVSIPQFDPPTVHQTDQIPPLPPLKGIDLSGTTATRHVSRKGQHPKHRPIGNAAELLPPPPREPPPTTMIQSPHLERNGTTGGKGDGNGWSRVNSPEEVGELNKNISMSTSFSGSESEMDSQLIGCRTDGMMNLDGNVSAIQKGTPTPYQRQTDNEGGRSRGHFTRGNNGTLDKKGAPQQQVDSGFLSAKEMAIAADNISANGASTKDTNLVRHSSSKMGKNTWYAQPGASAAEFHNADQSSEHNISKLDEHDPDDGSGSANNIQPLSKDVTEVGAADGPESSPEPSRSLPSKSLPGNLTADSTAALSEIFLKSPYVLPPLPFTTRPSSAITIPGLNRDDDDVDERNTDNELVPETEEVQRVDTKTTTPKTSIDTESRMKAQMPRNLHSHHSYAEETPSAKSNYNPATGLPPAFLKRDNRIRPVTDKPCNAPLCYPLSPDHPSPAMAPTMIPQSQSLSMKIFDVLASESRRFILYQDEKESERRTETAVGSGGKEVEGKAKGPVSVSHKIIMAATVEKLVERLTILVDYTFLTDFFFTYRCFISPVQLCKLLILRFRWALSGPDPLKDELRSLVRIRTFVTFRHWISLYYVYDFLASRTLRFTLATFLNDVRFHPVVKMSPRDARIVRGLRGMVKRLRRTYQRQNDYNPIRDANGANYEDEPSSLSETGRENETDGSIEDSNTTMHPINVNPSLKFGGQHDATQEKASISSAASAIASIRDRTLLTGQSTNGRNVEGRRIGSLPEGRAANNGDALRTENLRPEQNAAQRMPSSSQYPGRTGGNGSDARSIRDVNAWTLKMTFGLANLRKKIPEVYNSLVTGMGGPGTGLPECTCSAAMTGYGGLQEGSTEKTEKSLDREGAQNDGSISDVSNFDQHHRRESLLRKQHEPACPMFHLSSAHSTPFENKMPSSNSLHSLSQLSQHSSPPQQFYSDTPAIAPTPSFNINMNTFHFPSFLYQQVSSSSLPTPYRSFILDHRSELIARQFCIIEQRNLRGIHWDELVEVTWTKNGQKRSERQRRYARNGDHSMDGNSTLDGDSTAEGSGVMALIDRFNLTCQWVTSEVLSTQSLDDRVKVIEKFVRIGLKCLHHNNFSTLTQLLLGLQSPSISRLRKTWSRVGSYELRVLRDLQEFTSPFKNWKNIRDAMRRAGNSLGYCPDTDAVERAAARARRGPMSSDQPTEDSFSFRGGRSNFGSPRSSISRTGRKISQSSHAAGTSNSLLPTAGENASTGCIPFLGLYLSDLVFNAELPSLLDPHLDSGSAPPPANHSFQNESNFRVSLASYSPGDELPPQRLVNFHKYRTIATIIKSVLAFQALSRRYNFEADVSVYPRCVFLSCLDNVEARRLSHECES